MIGKKVKKFLSVVCVVLMLMSQTTGVLYAYSIPVAPSAPTAPTAPSAPSAPTAPTLEEFLTDDPVVVVDEVVSEPEEVVGSSVVIVEEDLVVEDDQGSALVSDSQVGDVEIETGDVNNTAVLTTTGNDNLSGYGDGDGFESAQEDFLNIINSENGADSENSTSVNIDVIDNTFQDNIAQVISGLEQDSVTGENLASRNVGNSSIETGDANVTGMISNSVNTNMDNVLVSEFNVVDDHVGDFVLDFEANCVQNCASGPIFSENSGNGVGSENNQDVNIDLGRNTFQTNDALLESNLVLFADSGNNEASFNTGGDSIIETGDANISAGVSNFANNNIEGGVVYGVVNIFGDLLGNIVVPGEEGGSACCGIFPFSLANTDNGAESENTIAVDSSVTDETFQFNEADIDNNIVVLAMTGGNEVNRNTNGDSEIETGEVDVDLQILNIINSNISTDGAWVVVINEIGDWTGQILGAEEGAVFATSEGLDIVDNGQGLVVQNTGNGAGSVNNTNVDYDENNLLVQSNTAEIHNNLDLSGNTGGNSASSNTGGDSQISTGDVNIMANIVNFVNNNIEGSGKLKVMVVNVFGNWLGDFVTSDYEVEVMAADLTDTGPEIGGDGLMALAQISESEESNSVVSDSSDSANESSSDSNNSVNSSNSIHESGSVSASVTVNTKVVGSVMGEEENNDTEVVDDGMVLSGSDYEMEGVVGGKTNINLAWFLPLIPVLLIVWGVRRYVLYRKQNF